ncbi:MAG: histidine kinase [Blastocatellia bacterium]
MKLVWQKVWPHLRARLLYVVYGLPLSLIPFFLNWQAFQTSGRLLFGLFSSLGFGLLVAVTVWTTFLAAYLALTWVYRQSGFFPRTRWWFDLGVALCGTVLGIGLMMGVQSWLWQVPISGGNFLISLVVGLICLTVFLLYSMYQEARAEALQQQAAVAEARYHVLEQQMRPHFLFNALNSLAELIEAKQDNAAEVAFTLSDLYRRILANSKTKTASLASEVEITQAYLELEQLRFGARLQYSFSLPDNPTPIFLPSLTLQTLVENAVKHGIARAIAGGSIEISVQPHAPQGYQLRVVNTGVPLATSGNANGTGLANTKERLALLYGARHQFQLITDEAGCTVASFYFTGEPLD